MKLGLCCSSLQRGFARELADRLERNLGISTLIVEDDLPVSSVWDQASASDAVLLLLDSVSAPGPVNRRDWESLLQHTDAPPVALLRLEPCHYPKLLERGRFAAPADPLEAQRWVERWLAPRLPRLEQGFEAGSCAAPVPDEWWSNLVDRPGTCFATPQDASAAQGFAREARKHFQAVHWIGCGHRRAPAILREIEYRTRGAVRLLSILVHARLPLDLPGGGRHSYLVLAGTPGAVESSGALAPWIGACQASGFPGSMMDLMLGNRRTEWEPLVAALDVERSLFRPPGQFATNGEAEERHLAVLVETFGGWRLQSQLCRELIGEAVGALRYGFRSNNPAARQLCLDLALFLLAEKRNSEAVAWLRLLVEEAGGESDLATAQRARRELSWLVDDAGELLPDVAVGEQLTLDFGIAASAAGPGYLA